MKLSRLASVAARIAGVWKIVKPRVKAEVRRDPGRDSNWCKRTSWRQNHRSRYHDCVIGTKEILVAQVNVIGEILVG